MKRVLIAAAMLCLLAGPVGVAGERGDYTGKGSTAATKCSEYLSEYGQSGIKREGSSISAAVAFFEYLGFFGGYMTGVNRALEGKQDWYVGLEPYDVAAWLSSWCRDNLSKYFMEGLHELTKQQVRKK